MGAPEDKTPACQSVPSSEFLNFSGTIGTISPTTKTCRSWRCNSSMCDCSGGEGGCGEVEDLGLYLGKAGTQPLKMLHTAALCLTVNEEMGLQGWTCPHFCLRPESL